VVSRAREQLRQLVRHARSLVLSHCNRGDNVKTTLYRSVELIVSLWPFATIYELRFTTDSNRPMMF
jgi:hypothetical protein